MPVFSFHLAESTIATTVGVLRRRPTAGEVPGLHHAEGLTVMRLGTRVVSPRRLQLRHVAMFASWDGEGAIDNFLDTTTLGREFASGWHVRLEFLRRWGHLSELDDLTRDPVANDPNEPVVAVTLARLKLPQLARFIRWGKPVEELVRDDPGTTLALAGMRPPRTVSTFSVWRSARQMTQMVSGEAAVAQPTRHADAMAELRRKDFHHEFITLRFRSLGEYGTWEGRTGIVPQGPNP